MRAHYELWDDAGNLLAETTEHFSAVSGLAPFRFADMLDAPAGTYTIRLRIPDLGIVTEGETTVIR